MYKYSKKSLDRIAECHPFLQEICFALIQRIDVSVLCGYRNEYDQNTAYKNGNSKLQYPHSKHNKKPSLAVDISPYPINWNDLDRFNAMCDLIETIAEDLGISVKMGRDFSFRDYPHVELYPVDLNRLETDLRLCESYIQNNPWSANLEDYLRTQKKLQKMIARYSK